MAEPFPAVQIQKADRFVDGPQAVGQIQKILPCVVSRVQQRMVPCGIHAVADPGRERAQVAERDCKHLRPAPDLMAARVDPADAAGEVTALVQRFRHRFCLAFHRSILFFMAQAGDVLRSTLLRDAFQTAHPRSDRL